MLSSVDAKCVAEDGPRRQERETDNLIEAWGTALRIAEGGFGVARYLGRAEMAFA